jgi:hypothetical protein
MNGTISLRSGSTTLGADLGRNMLAVLAIAFGVLSVEKAQAQNQFVWPRSHSDVQNFQNPTQAYDHPNLEGTFAHATNLGRICSAHCTTAQTATITFHNFVDGYLPVKLEVRWTAFTAMVLLSGNAARVTATLEYDLGSGWLPWESHEWTQSSPSCPPGGTDIVCSAHISSRDLLPTQSSGSVRVRVTISSRMTQCSSCGPFGNSNLSAVARVYDVRLVAGPPVLTVTPSSVTRGQSATLDLKGAPEGQVSNWRYVTSEPAVGTIDRSSGATDSTWSGTIVAGGKALVNVTSNGQAYNDLEVAVVVEPRSWFFPAATATEQQPNSYTYNCRGDLTTLTVVSPTLMIGGDGVYQICLDIYFPQANVSTVPGEGPNKNLKYVTDIGDLTVANWLRHADVTNTTSAWYVHQCGNFVPSQGNSCASPSGSGYISGHQYSEGVARHEAGPQNSHHAQYVAAQNIPSNNLKAVAELQVGAVTRTAEQFFNDVLTVLYNRIAIIQAATSPQPCGATCDPTCTAFMGWVNPPPYATCP